MVETPEVTRVRSRSKGSFQNYVIQLGGWVGLSLDYERITQGVRGSEIAKSWIT